MGRRYNNILLSDINYDSTCITVIPDGLPVSLACENCKAKLDVHSKRSSVQSNKKQRNKHSRNRCRQYWSDFLLENPTITEGQGIMHNRTRRFLGIETNLVLEYVSEYNKNNLVSSASKKKRLRTEEKSIAQAHLIVPPPAVTVPPPLLPRLLPPPQVP